MTQRHHCGARDVEIELHHALQRPGLPVHPSIRVDGCYLVPDARGAGGDWLDAAICDDGRLALVVGDVVGRGVEAVATMTQLRPVLRELLTSGTDLDRALVRLDHYARTLPGAHGTTLCAVVLDPMNGHLRYATCGHPPPLLVDASGVHRYLPMTGARPLGATGAPRVLDETLAEGEVLLLYTNGLIQRPGRTVAAGMADLARATADATPSLRTGVGDSATARVAAWALRWLDRGEYTDDIAVLAARRASRAMPELHLTQPATPAAAHHLRGALDVWLTAHGAVTTHIAALQLAVTEAVTNSIEHAYPTGRPGTVEFHAQLTGSGQFVGTVTDHGRWREPDRGHSHRGRGMAMISGSVDAMTIHHPDGGGTTITIRHRLTRPVDVIDAGSPVGIPFRMAKPQMPYTATVEWRPEPFLRVTGPLDITTSDEFDALLRTTARGGAIDLTVELTEVTLLASAGVRVLHRLADQLHTRNLHLIAAHDSPAHHVLDIVGLAHTEPGGGISAEDGSHRPPASRRFSGGDTYVTDAV